MTIEWRLAVAALVVGLALLVAGLLQGCSDDEEANGGAASSTVTRDFEAEAPDLALGDRYDSFEVLPPCPDRTRPVNFDHGSIVAGGHAVRLFYATSSSYVPCGFVAGDNGAAMVLEVRAANPHVALADLNGRCVDAVLRAPVEADLEIVSARPERGPGWSPQARADEVGPDSDCPDVRPIPRATIDVD